MPIDFTGITIRVDRHADREITNIGALQLQVQLRHTRLQTQARGEGVVAQALPFVPHLHFKLAGTGVDGYFTIRPIFRHDQLQVSIQRCVPTQGVRQQRGECRGREVFNAIGDILSREQSLVLGTDRRLLPLPAVLSQRELARFGILEGRGL